MAGGLKEGECILNLGFRQVECKSPSLFLKGKALKNYKVIVDGLAFAQAVAALDGGMANLPSSDMEDGSIARFLEEHGLLQVPHLFIANHSIGGREWVSEPGRTPAFLSDPCFGSEAGWNVLREEDVQFVRITSATTGSCLTAEKEADGLWTVSLNVPFEEGKPYRGAYWGSFHAALGLDEG